jgi:phytoene dehydrogenase-like protein
LALGTGDMSEESLTTGCRLATQRMLPEREMATGGARIAIVGAGHNALVAATLLARAGLGVTCFERCSRVGGAAISTYPFAGVDVRISPYAYLVSLFPSTLLATLGVDCELRRRHPSSCTPDGDHALVVDDEATTRHSFETMGIPEDYRSWSAWHRLMKSVASVMAPTLMEPLRAAPWFRSRMGAEAWHVLAERPLGLSVHDAFGTDLVRGLVLTDGLIGTFCRTTDTDLRANRCYLYHLIGNSTGEWRVPVGGMGQLTDGLARAALGAGVEIRLGTEIVSVDADGRRAELLTSTGERHGAAVVLCGAAPAVLDRLLGSRGSESDAEGAQIKVNMALRRLPQLRCSVVPSTAFSGTLHINERASQLERAWQQAESGTFPSPIPCEVYCHSLTDPSVIGALPDGANAHVVSLFALQTPARLFSDPALTSQVALERCLASFQEVLAEPLDDCILRTPAGDPCIEVHTPTQLAEALALPGGNIFHGDLQWPWAEDDADVGRWGAETEIENVFLCGSGARRGGAVSGIGGHNAAMATLSLLGRDAPPA